MSYEFESRVAGIPCIIRVTSYSSGRPANIWGRPEDCYPEEYPEVEFQVCDRRGRPAPWLERKLDTKRWQELESRVFKELDRASGESRYDY